ncbi:MAG: peptidoglycan recognition family protein [Candidatus Daviesbacteria bacterium]|nr:peptidoglycan recognition family protein [Candidatus Daviesbacteria bacterium]
MIKEILLNTDDGEEDYGTDWYPNGYSGNQSTIGHDGTGDCDVGLIFDDTGIAEAANILAAKIRVKCAVNSTKRPVLVIRGILEPDPATWGSASRPSTRAKTTASVAWSPGADWTLNNWYESPDIKTIIQEIVNQEGFSGAIGLVIENNGSPGNNYELIWDYNSGEANAAELDVTLGSTTKIEKSLSYYLEPQINSYNLPKQLRYAVNSTPAAVTKSLTYRIDLPGVSLIQKQLKYYIKTTPAAITKSLKYCIAKASAKITKSLRYTVTPPPPIQKQLKYGITTEHLIEKELRYFIQPAITPTEKSKNQVLKIKRIIDQNLDDGKEDSDGVWNKDGNTNHIITMGNYGGKTYAGAFRFRHVDVPKNATIVFARLRLRAATTDATAFTTKLRIKGIKEIDTKPFNSATKPSTRAKTVTSVSWEIYKQWTMNEWVQTPNLLLVVQELVRQSDWKAGNAMAFVVEDDTSTAGNSKTCWDSSSGEEDKAELEIYYFDKEVNVSFLQLNDRDGEEDYRDRALPDNVWYPSGYSQNRITCGDDGTYSPEESPNDAGFIFSPVQIPKGSQIVFARLLVTSDNQNNSMCNFIIKGFAEDNAAVFATDGSTRPSTRPKTTAQKQWALGAASGGVLAGVHWTAQSVYESPELKEIIQEIVDRAGWIGDATQKLGLVIESEHSNSGNIKYIVDWSKGGAGKWAAQLVIAWQKIRRTTTTKQDKAFYDKANYPEYIIVHHTATARDGTHFITIKNAHIGYGWEDIGYHKFIGGALDGDGILIEGRPENKVGAHTDTNKMNYRSLGVVVCGEFDTEYPTAAQLATLQQLLDDLRKQRHIPKENVLGHHEVSGAATDCPGNHLLPYIVNYRLTGSLT